MSVQRITSGHRSLRAYRSEAQVDAEGYFIDAEGDRVDDLDQFSDLDSE